MILFPNGTLEATAAPVLLARAAEEGLVFLGHLRQPRTRRVNDRGAAVAAGHVPPISAHQAERVPAINLPGLQIQVRREALLRWRGERDDGSFWGRRY